MAIGVKVITDRRGRKHVVMPLGRYERILRMLEDRSDLAVVRRRAREAIIPYSEVRRRLGLA